MKAYSIFSGTDRRKNALNGSPSSEMVDMEDYFGRSRATALKPPPQLKIEGYAK
jgi:hypothetical protein